MRKLNKLLAGASALVLASFNTQASCVPANCNTLGYTKSASDCDGSDMIKCPFDTDKVWCMEGEKTVEPYVGAIYNSDGTFTDDMVNGKTPVGVVASIDGKHGFVIALDDKSSLSWSSPDNEDISCISSHVSVSPASKDYDGAANTQCIINYSSSNKHPAAEYCYEYRAVSVGIGNSGWYLPAGGEWLLAFSNIDAINMGLQKLSKAQLSGDIHYWTSTEAFEEAAWWADVRNRDIYGPLTKSNELSARCVLAF